LTPEQMRTLRERAEQHEHTHIPHSRAQVAVHGSGVAGRFNRWLAVKITNSVGTMYCAYVFLALSCISLPSTLQSGDVGRIVTWITQTFLQLVLLPIIMVGQNVQAAINELQSKEDSETLRIVHQIDTRTLQIAEEMHSVVIPRERHA